MLNEDEKQLFARASVFAGGCTLEAGRAVAGGDLDTLESLVDKSLIRHSDDRFWMLATIREFAQERLAESGERLDLQRLHVEYFTDLARHAEAELRGPDAARWLSELEQELNNVRGALMSSLEDGQFELALALSAGLYRFWLAHGRASEGRRWLDELIARAQSASPELRGTALYRASDMALWQGDYERAAELSSQAIPLLRDAGQPSRLCEALSTEGWAVGALGDRERALILLEEALQLAREHGLESEAASALNSLAALHKAEGEYVRALEFNEACLEIIERAGDPLNVAIVLGNVGEAALGVGAIPPGRTTSCYGASCWRESSATHARRIGRSRTLRSHRCCRATRSAAGTSSPKACRTSSRPGTSERSKSASTASPASPRRAARRSAQPGSGEWPRACASPSATIRARLSALSRGGTSPPRRPRSALGSPCSRPRGARSRSRTRSRWPAWTRGHRLSSRRPAFDPAGQGLLTAGSDCGPFSRNRFAGRCHRLRPVNGRFPRCGRRGLETCGPVAPGPVHRSVQKLHTASPQLLAHRVDVVDFERELESYASIAARHQRGFDQTWRFRGLQEIDQGGAELEHCRVFVFVMDG